MRILLIALLLAPPPLLAQFGYNSVDTYAGTGIGGLVDGSLGTSGFAYPYGICYDQVTNTFYVADAFNHCIRKMQGGTVTTVAGNGVAGDVDAQGANARFDTPTGVFYKNGFLYIADNYNNKIKRMDGLGNVETIAGTGAVGATDGPAALSEFYEPKSITVDDSGTVYIADYENHLIRMLKDGVVSTIAGTGSPGDGVGPALSAELHRPRDLCIDDSGNIYFVDLMNNKVKLLTTAGEVQLVAGSGVPGTVDGIGSLAQFNRPVGIDWLATGVLIVLDSFTPKVRRVTISGVVNTIAGSGGVGYVDDLCSLAEFDLPQDVCVDNIGNIYVGDRNNNVIRIISHALPQAEMEYTSEATEVAIYPVPASNVLMINIPEIDDKVLEIQISDAAGRDVIRLSGSSVKVIDHCIVVDVSTMSSGRYFTQIRLLGGRILNSGFLK